MQAIGILKHVSLANGKSPLSDLEMLLATGNKVRECRHLADEHLASDNSFISQSAEWQADKTVAVVLRPREGTVCCC